MSSISQVSDALKRVLTNTRQGARARDWVCRAQHSAVRWADLSANDGLWVDGHQRRVIRNYDTWQRVWECR